MRFAPNAKMVFHHATNRRYNNYNVKEMLNLLNLLWFI